MLDTKEVASIINSASGETVSAETEKKGTVEVAQGLKQTAPLKICARPGCDVTVKKATARYCSIRCCALDPSRQERLRRQARRAPIVPLAHQLSMIFQVHADIETLLDNRSFA